MRIIIRVHKIIATLLEKLATVHISYYVIPKNIAITYQIGRTKYKLLCYSYKRHPAAIPENPT